MWGPVPPRLGDCHEIGSDIPHAQFLIVSYHRHLNDRPLELEERAKYYHDKRLKEQLQRESEGTLIKEETRKKNGGN